MVIFCLRVEDYRSVIIHTGIGRDHEHLDGRAADWGLLPDPEDERDDVPHLQARGAPEEPGGVRQHGLPRTAHVRLCAGGSRGGCVEDLSFVDLVSDPTFQKIHDLFLFPYTY